MLWSTCATPMQLSIAPSSVSYTSFHLRTSSGFGLPGEQGAHRLVVDGVALFLEMLDQCDALIDGRRLSHFGHRALDLDRRAARVHRVSCRAGGSTSVM